MRERANSFFGVFFSSYVCTLFAMLLAAGLYCLAELIEEYTVLARRMIFYLVVVNGFWH